MPRWIRFVFTSRPEKSVKKYFRTSESVDITGSMPSGYNDILAYLIKTLAEELCQISNKLEILNKICELSDGVFLYAEMLVNDIKNGFVKMTDIDHFPMGLNAFYRLSMERKYPDRHAFDDVRGLIELLTLSETIPEELVRSVLGFSQYSLIKHIDKLGSWVNQYNSDNQSWLGFSKQIVFLHHTQNCLRITVNPLSFKPNLYTTVSVCLFDFPLAGLDLLSQRQVPIRKLHPFYIIIISASGHFKEFAHFAD